MQQFTTSVNVEQADDSTAPSLQRTFPPVSPLVPLELPSAGRAVGKPLPTPTRSAVVRVLHVINGEDYSGAERVQDLLALHLPELGFDVAFACVKPGRFDKTRRSRDTPLFEVAMRSKIDLRPAWTLSGRIRDEGYRLVHTHSPRTALVGRLASAMARVPIVHHIQSPTSSDTTHRLRNWFNATAERISMTRVDAVIAVSNSMTRYARQMGVRRERIFVIPNGAPTPGPLRDRPRPRGEWVIGTVALFRPRKGIEVLLDALARVRNQGMSLRLRAVGCFQSPEYEQDIRRRVARLRLTNAIDWIGFSSDVDSELRRMDIFVLPSLFGEGLPLAILEAMAVGVPVVSTRVEGIPEAVRHRRDGLIVPPNDAGALANAIAGIVRGKVDWSDLRASAYRRQVDSFSDYSMSVRIAKVYKRVLGLA